MGKRPSGFGKASKQKKQKPEATPEPSPVPEGEAELNIELNDNVEDDELAEVYGLYAKLREERDPKLARGIVHESDQLLRDRDSKGEELPPKFHIVYGGALLTLADPTFAEAEAEAFRDTGVERIDVGITAASGPGNDEARGIAALELVQYVHTQIEDGALPKQARKLLKKAQNILNSTEGTNLELAKAASQLQQLADDLGDDDKSMNIAKDMLLRHAERGEDAESKRIGNKGLGQFYLSAVAPALEALEAEDGSDQDDENAQETSEHDASNAVIVQDLESARDHLRKSLSESDPESYVMLAETILQWMGFTEDEKEENKAQAEALRLLKKAQLLGNDSLREVIESLENDDDEE